MTTAPAHPINQVRVGGALHDVKPIPNWILCGDGFTRNEGKFDNGVPALARYLHEIYAGPNLRVEYFKWSEDWAAKADWIFGCAGGGSLARILFLGYSWSVGNGFRQLCKAFERRGMTVERAVLTDGVYHLGGNWMHKCLLSQIYACLPRPWGRPKIRLPRLVVKHIEWFVQSPKNFRWLDYNTWLRGHNLIWDENGMPVAGRVNVEGVLHTWMSECEPFQQAAMKAAADMFGTKT